MRKEKTIKRSQCRNQNRTETITHALPCFLRYNSGNPKRASYLCKYILSCMHYTINIRKHEELTEKTPHAVAPMYVLPHRECRPETPPRASQFVRWTTIDTNMGEGGGGGFSIGQAVQDCDLTKALSLTIWCS